MQSLIYSCGLPPRVSFSWQFLVTLTYIYLILLQYQYKSSLNAFRSLFIQLIDDGFYRRRIDLFARSTAKITES
jgi:hypothetical protein